MYYSLTVFNTYAYFIAFRAAARAFFSSSSSSGWHYLSNATCLIRPQLFSLCIVYSVRDHHNLLHDSPRLKKTCTRQVVLDKCFPLIIILHVLLYHICCLFFLLLFLVVVVVAVVVVVVVVVIVLYGPPLA